MKPRLLYRRKRRKGNIVVLTAFLMVALMALLAFAIDIGYIMAVKTEMQRTADAAAIAAAWELLDENLQTGTSSGTLSTNARSEAQLFTGYNKVRNASLSLSSDDVLIGHRDNPFNTALPIQTASSCPLNTVRVRVQHTAMQNGEVPLFFARVLGYNSQSLQEDATAALLTSFGGFKTPSDGSNLEILPFALDKETWDDLLDGAACDNWTWDSECKHVECGSDGILEVNLYPQGTGSPGNRGTIDIGSSSNSTNDIKRQILDGISDEDMEHHNGVLEFNDDGELYLNGDTGISAGFKAQLEEIKGEPRIIPIFQQVEGNGNNAEYTIVCWAGVRIMEVKLTGSNNQKRVIVQPCNITVRGGIPSTSTSSSYFMYSPVILVE